MPFEPAELRAFAARDWGRLDALDRARRARMTVEERMRIAAALYAAARETRPGWPTREDRLEDLAHHCALRALLRRAADVPRR